MALLSGSFCDLKTGSHHVSTESNNLTYIEISSQNINLSLTYSIQCRLCQSQYHINTLLKSKLVNVDVCT